MNYGYVKVAASVPRVRVADCKFNAGQIENVERATKDYSDVIAKVDNQMLELRRQIENM